MNLNQFLDRQYDLTAYNCGHFVTEVWKEVTGEDITDLCSDFISTGFAKTRRKLERLPRPKNPCLIVMAADHLPPHVGVFIENKVIHLQESGPISQSLIFLPRHYQLSFFRYISN